MATNREITTEKTGPATIDEEKEAAFEDLVDQLGAEPPDQSEGASPDGAAAGEQPTDVTSQVSLPEGGDVELDDVIPDARPDQLDNQGLAAGLPENEHPSSSDHSDLGVEGAVVDGPLDYTDVDPADLGIEGADPFLNDDFDSLVNPDQGAGGLDGRNDASDRGSGNPSDGPSGELDPNDPLATPEFERSGLGNPYAGAGFDDGSAAGALPPQQQAVLKGYHEQAQAAAAAGDHDLVDEINKETENYLIDLAAPEKFASGGAVVGHDPVEGVQATPAQKAMAEAVEEEGGFKKGASDAIAGKVHLVPGPDGGPPVLQKTPRQEMLEAAEAAIKESSTPQNIAEDYGEGDLLNGPDPHADFTNEVFEKIKEAEAGADVDPNPNDDGGDFSAVADVQTDGEQFTAEYEHGYVPDESVGEDRAAAYDPTPDEEFLDT